MRSAVGLVSGGCDSAILLVWLARRYPAVHPVYVRFGLVWETAELAHLRRFLRAARIPRLKPLTVVSLPVTDTYAGHWSVSGRGVPGARSPDRTMYLPGRNLLLISRGATLCAVRRAHVLALGTLRANPFRDASRKFLNQMGGAISLALGWRIKVITPFARKSKAEVLKLGRHLPLELTFSCVAARRTRHCGRCNKCAERKRSFRAAGLPDLTRYS